MRIYYYMEVSIFALIKYFVQNNKHKEFVKHIRSVIHLCAFDDRS